MGTVDVAARCALLVAVSGCAGSIDSSLLERLPVDRRDEFRSASSICAGTLPGKIRGGLPMFVEVSAGRGDALARRMCAVVSPDAVVVVRDGRLFVRGENVDVQRAVNFVRSESGLPVVDVVFCSGRVERASGRFAELYEVKSPRVLRAAVDHICREILSTSSWLDVVSRPMEPPVERTNIGVLASAAEHREICRYLKTVGEGADCTLSDEEGNWLNADGGVMEE